MQKEISAKTNVDGVVGNTALAKELLAFWYADVKLEYAREGFRVFGWTDGYFWPSEVAMLDDKTVGHIKLDPTVDPLGPCLGMSPPMRKACACMHNSHGIMHTSHAHTHVHYTQMLDLTDSHVVTVMHNSHGNMHTSYAHTHVRYTQIPDRIDTSMGTVMHP